MCGIAGFFQRSLVGDHGAVDPGQVGTLERMMSALQKRGPDGEGRWLGTGGETRVFFGHRRLAIVDLESGQQPMASHDGRFVMVFNGEIFNFMELREQLVAAGHRFITRSDSEVIIEAFRAWGEDSFRRLNGMYAFALLDQVERRVYLVRDPLGIKPFYYYDSQGLWVFASDLRAVLAHPAVPHTIARSALPAYFFSEYFLPPATVCSAVRQLLPGHFIKAELDGFQWSQPQRFFRWDRELSPRGDGARSEVVATGASAGSQFDDFLAASLRRQLTTDVPVGVLLSGGLDSSAIAAMATRQWRRSERLMSFSMGVDDPDFNELPLARRVAERCQTDHRELTLNEGVFLERMDEALSCLDQPLADPSVIPTFLLSEFTARSVKVALSGDGGDEIFAGYPTYQAHRWLAPYRYVPVGIHRMVRAAIHRLPVQDGRWSLEWKLKRALGRYERDPLRRHLRWMAGTDVADLFTPSADMGDFLAEHSAYTDLLTETSEGGALRTALDGPSFLDLRTYLSAGVLMKSDRCSMHHGLELRPPFLDFDLMRWGLVLPWSSKLRAGATKVLVRDFVRRSFGNEIADAPKRGFGVPLNKWLKGGLRDRVSHMLHESLVFDGGLLPAEYFREHWRAHLEGAADHTRLIWSFFVLEDWCRRIGR